MSTSDITVGANVRVRGLTNGRPPHGTVVRAYVAGDFKVKLNTSGMTLRVEAERLTVI